MTAKEKMKKLISEQPTDTLKDTAKNLMTTFETGAGVAFEMTLSEIQKRMSEKEFIEFCDSM